ncbi:MAG: tetratricopeptide repeat protein [Gallionella sp.]|nr:tetratricopeptide repeat protein [Gallionella sp.]
MNILNRLPLSAALLFGILSISPALQADELQDATQLFKQGQHSQALNKVNNFLANKPRDAQGRFLQGLIFTEQGKIPDAIKVFSGLTADYPELPEPYNNLAVLYASQSQYDKAKSSLEMAIRTHPSYATAHENLGDIYAKMASQAYDRALQLDNTNTTTQTKLAMIQDLFTDKPRSKAGAVRNPALLGNKPQPIASAPAAKPVVSTAASAAPVKVAAVSDKMLNVLEAVDAWAAAWSAKNVKKYLSHYASDFKTPDGESRKAWAENRKERINRPKYIDVKVRNGTVDFTDDTHATVKFHQDYRASNFKASGSKTLLMVKSGGNWLIQEERTR